MYILVSEHDVNRGALADPGPPLLCKEHLAQMQGSVSLVSLYNAVMRDTISGRVRPGGALRTKHASWHRTRHGVPLRADW